MSPPHVLASASLLLLRQELEELYRLQADQAARLAGLEGEVFLLKRRLREQGCEPEHASARWMRPAGLSQVAMTAAYQVAPPFTPWLSSGSPLANARFPPRHTLPPKLH